MRRILSALLAAVTSTEAVKAEKSLAVLILVRVLITVGAGGGIVELVKQLGQ